MFLHKTNSLGVSLIKLLITNKLLGRFFVKVKLSSLFLKKMFFLNLNYIHEYPQNLSKQTIHKHLDSLPRKQIERSFLILFTISTNCQRFITR